MDLALLYKFPHWSEVLSVFNYADEVKSGKSSVEFLAHKRGVRYTDPLGMEYETKSRSHFSEGTPLIVNGSIHLETFPLSKGKIPYTSFPRKVAIEHTAGYSPWDFLQMVNLAQISASGSEDAQGSKVLYLINDKCYRRFMSTDWMQFGKSYYESKKEEIADLVDKGFVVPTKIEPAQFWLENVPSSVPEVSDHLCLCLNWCNIDKVRKVNQVVNICSRLHNYTGKEIDIRLHSYSRESLFKIFREKCPYVNLIPYESMSKYAVMDRYSTYFVDGTGLGYEIAYRCKFRDRPVDIFYLRGLSSDEPKGGFDGISEMGAVPRYDFLDFIRGECHSNFSEEVISESFPHTPGNAENESYQLVVEGCNRCLSL